MSYDKLKKEELLEVVFKLENDKVVMQQKITDLLEIEKRNKIILQGSKEKDFLIKDLNDTVTILKNNMELFEQEKTDLINKIEQQTNEAIKKSSAQAMHIAKDYEILKGSVAGTLEVNKVLVDLKKEQDKALEKVILIFNETLFEEEK
jgi:protein involved in temperature-dependent protein secretion